MGVFRPTDVARGTSARGLSASSGHAEGRLPRRRGGGSGAPGPPLAAPLGAQRRAFERRRQKVRVLGHDDS